MNLARQLADSLRRLRAERNLTQVEMAKALGTSQSTLNRLESASQNTTLRTLNQLCRALRCGVGELFLVPTRKGRATRRGRNPR